MALVKTAKTKDSVSVLSQKFSVPKTHQIRSMILFLPKAVGAFNTKEILIIFFTIRCPIFAHIFSMQQFSTSFALKTPNMEMFIQCHQRLSILYLGFIDFTARIQNIESLQTWEPQSGLSQYTMIIRIRVPMSVVTVCDAINSDICRITSPTIVQIQ